MLDLSVIEQSPRSRTIYTQLCFCYANDNNTSHEEVVATLTKGLKRLTTSFPWLAGQVVNENVSPGNSGTTRVISFEKLSRLVVRDLKDDTTAPTMSALKAAEFPFSMLQEDLICPRSTLSDRPGETKSDPAPVFILQANFLVGGLLLTILASHSVMDIAGQVQMIRLLSKACRNEAFTDEEVANANLDRRNLIPLHDNSWNPEEKPTNSAPSKTVHDSTDIETLNSPPELIWAYFSFNATSLTNLKREATSTIPPSSSTKFISTDDALCALLWQSIARARTQRLPLSATTTFTRAVDMRSHTGIPTTYSGNLAFKTSDTSTLDHLAKEPLGNIAAQLRSTLNPETLLEDFKASATLQSRTKDKSSSGSAKDRTNTITMSSWAKAACDDLEFGLGLGVPEAIRRPSFTPIEGVVYILPKERDGGLAVGLCLRVEDMERLRGDELLKGYARFIG